MACCPGGKSTRPSAQGRNGPWNVFGVVTGLPQRLTLEDGREYQVRVLLDDMLTQYSAIDASQILPAHTGARSLKAQPTNLNMLRILLWIGLPLLGGAGLIIVQLIRRNRRVLQETAEEILATRQVSVSALGTWDPQSGGAPADRYAKVWNLPDRQQAGVWR